MSVYRSAPLRASRGHFFIVLSALSSWAVAAAAQDASPAASLEDTTGTRPVVVFAAASLKTALDAVATAWGSAGGRTRISYAASGALAKQIENGAPADVFISADRKWMSYVEEKKLVRADSIRMLLGNTLVLIAPRDSAATVRIEKGFDLAGLLGEGRLAMGVPGAVPAGTYAKAALTSLGIWDAVSPKIAGADNVRGALAFVARGEAPFGIVYATDAAAEAGVKVVGTFPADTHAPIVYPVALTSSSTNAAAVDFLDYLSTPAAVRHFEKQGFTVLK